MEKLAHIDKCFTFNITHDLNNKVTEIVWITSYMKDNFERFGNYLSIDVMRSSISNTTELCYMAPVVLNEIGRSNVVCEGFVITENHDVYTFILESLFQMSSTRSKENVHAIYADEFMPQNILDSIGMKNTRIFYDHFYLKLYIEKALISKWDVLSPIINSMFIAKNEVILNLLYEQVKTLCGHLNNYVLIIVHFIDKKKFWAPFLIDKVKGTLKKRGSSHSESNHSSVNIFVIRNVDGIHGTMKELMNRQKV